MKGKKINSEFISSFISECVNSGIETPDEIVARAKDKIVKIEEEIKLIENKKKLRANLLDVIDTFEKPKRTKNYNEIRALSFFSIKYPDTCKDICNALKNNAINVQDIKNIKSDNDIVYCVKQLIEQKIISRSGDFIYRGESFDEYQKFIS